MYKRLLVTAYMKSPVVANNELYLDGIIYRQVRRDMLGAGYYDLPRFAVQRGDVKVRLKIKRWRGSYLASMARLRGAVSRTTQFHKKTNQLRATHYVVPQRIYTNQKIYRDYRVPIDVTSLERITWVVVGDGEWIADVLSRVEAIGKKPSQGYGIVSAWTVEPTSIKGLRHFRLMGSVEKLGSYQLDKRTVNPPYATTHRTVPCVLQKF